MTPNELRRAAEIVRIAAIAEHARIIGDTDTLARILDQIDPAECDELAAELDIGAAIGDLVVDGVVSHETRTIVAIRKPW